jgi:hypothetical protein
MGQTEYNKLLRLCQRLSSRLSILKRYLSRLGLNGSVTEKLQVQASRKLDLWQGCHEVPEKSSKIVPLGAPLFCSLQSETYGSSLAVV